MCWIALLFCVLSIILEATRGNPDCYGILHAAALVTFQPALSSPSVWREADACWAASTHLVQHSRTWSREDK